MSLAKELLERFQSERKSFEVPEWAGSDGSPFIIYFSHFKAFEMDRVARKHPGFWNEMTMAGMAEVIIMKAEDKDGNKLFSLDDKKFLMDHPPQFISRIGGAMMLNESVEEKEKN